MLAPGMLALGIMAKAGPAAAADPYVAVTAIVEHMNLDAVRDGVRDRLAEAGLSAGQNLRFEYYSAGADPARAAEIARAVVASGPDVIVAISTPSAAAAGAATNVIPIVFAAVEDPLVAGLVAKSRANVTGLSHGMPLVEHLALIREILPLARKIGVTYGSANKRAASALRELTAAAPEYGFEIVAAPVGDENEIASAMRGMVGAVDAVLLLDDDDVAAAALDAVVDIAGQAALPVFATDPDMVAGGAVASVVLNYYDLGRQAGELVLRILDGEPPARIPVRRARATGLIVNPESAARMGIGLPASIIARANSIIQ
ncbi:MAG: ABC transporter substrate-binding protein [Alphaproteobacteria bacterium]|nr:ABC transporter substrate-binding protein [Alphaproteobacteria bacterium]